MTSNAREQCNRPAIQRPLKVKRVRTTITLQAQQYDEVWQESTLRYFANANDSCEGQRIATGLTVELESLNCVGKAGVLMGKNVGGGLADGPTAGPSQSALGQHLGIQDLKPKPTESLIHRLQARHSCEFVYHQPVLLAATVRKGLSF